MIRQNNGNMLTKCECHTISSTSDIGPKISPNPTIIDKLATTTTCTKYQPLCQYHDAAQIQINKIKLTKSQCHTISSTSDIGTKKQE